MKKISVLIYALFFILFIQTSNAKELVVTFGDFNSEPYAFVKDHTLKGGIIKDIMDEVGVKLNIKIKYLKIPRKRVSNYLLSGKIHVRLISNPKWFSNHEQFHWSTALFKENDKIVINTKDANTIKNINDLQEKRLGTILGYRYQIFKNHNIIRDDAKKLKSNFIRLERGRIDALIDSDILINYYINKNKKQKQFTLLKENASSHSIHAMYSKKYLPISFKKIDEAFIELKKDGTIQKILDKYK